MKSADYNNQLFKQVQELIDKCDSLSADIKRERKEFKKEKQILNEKLANKSQ